jgi:hypothetical protein
LSDLRELFDRSAREMRPELRARLIELYQRSLAETGAEPDITDSVPDLVEVGPRPQGGRQPRRAVWWLAIAAASALVFSMAVFSHNRSQNLSDPEVSSADPEQSGCVGSDAVGTAEIDGDKLLIGLMSDGQTFCIARGQGDDEGDASGVVAGRAGPEVAPTEPELVEAGPGPGTTNTYFYTFAIPDSLPVGDVRSASGKVEFFTSRVGRRLLIIDSHVDFGSTSEVSHLWDLYGIDGTFLRAVTALGPPSSSASE